jgi:hypothetical protein
MSRVTALLACHAFVTTDCPGTELVVTWPLLAPCMEASGVFRTCVLQLCASGTHELMLSVGCMEHWLDAHRCGAGYVHTSVTCCLPAQLHAVCWECSHHNPSVSTIMHVEHAKTRITHCN